MTTLAQYTKMLRDFEAAHPLTQAPNPYPWEMGSGGIGSDVIRGASTGEYIASQQYQDFLNSLPDKGAEYTQLDNARYKKDQNAARIKFAAIVATAGIGAALAAMPEMAGALEAGSAAGGAGDAGAGLGWMGGADATGVGTMGDAIAGGAGSATGSIGGGSLFDQGVNYSKALDTANALRGGTSGGSLFDQGVDYSKPFTSVPPSPGDSLFNKGVDYAKPLTPAAPPVDPNANPLDSRLANNTATTPSGGTPIDTSTGLPKIPAIPSTTSGSNTPGTSSGSDLASLLGGAGLGAAGLAAINALRNTGPLPAIPDYTKLAEQTAASKQAAIDTQTQANRPNQTNAQGDTSTWTKDPATGQWTQKQAFGTAGQAKFDQTNSILSALRGQVGATAGQPLNAAPLQPSAYTPMGSSQTMQDVLRTKRAF